MAAENTLSKLSQDRWRWIIQGQIEGRERDIRSGYIAHERKGALNASIANAKNFLKKSGLSPEMIADCCSLSLEQVLALKEEVKTES